MKRRMFGYEGRKWVAYFWFVGWDCLSIGIHVGLGAPNIEIHVPFGFIRLGRRARNEWEMSFAGWQLGPLSGPQTNATRDDEEDDPILRTICQTSQVVAAEYRTPGEKFNEEAGYAASRVGYVILRSFGYDHEESIALFKRYAWKEARL